VQRGAGLLALADQHRVQDHVGEGALAERGRDGVDGGGGAEHADLHGVDLVHRGGGLDLVGDHLRVDGHEAVAPVVLRVEGDDAGQSSGAEGAELMERLQVGLRPGASGGLGAGDGEGDVGHGGLPRRSRRRCRAPRGSSGGAVGAVAAVGTGRSQGGILAGPDCPSPRSCRALPGSGALRTGPSQRPRPDPTASGTVPGVLTPDPTTQDSPASTAPAGTSVRSRLAATAKQHLRPTSLFLLVGGVVFLLDTAMYNLLVFWSPSRGWGAGLLHGTPLTAKLLTIAVASCLTYLGNRLLTFGDRPRPDTARSLMMFVLVNLIAAGLQLSCLAFSRYVLGLDSVLADNISGTLVGQVVSTSFRYVTYGRLVFPKR